MSTKLRIGGSARVVVATAFGILVGSLVLSNTREGQAQKRAQDVTVVNTADEAVPTVAQGTTTISGSVNVANTPTVNLGSGTTVGIDATSNTVRVDNAAPNPLWIRDVDNARQPFQVGSVLTVPNGQLLGLKTVMTVPAGKRLVIEYVSANIGVPVGQKVLAFVLQSPPLSVSHYLTPTSAGPTGVADIYTVSQQLRLYANPGDDVLVAVSRNGTTGAASIDLAISGYFIDVP